MARFLASLIKHEFAVGMTYYEDTFSDDEETVRIVLRARIAGRLIPFIVDTGAPWCVLDPEIAQPLIAGQIADHTTYLNIRGYRYSGGIFPMEIHLQDEQGTLFGVESSVFVPNLDSDDIWPHPNFLGLSGFLNRLRFAVDPEENAFYFGTN